MMLLDRSSSKHYLTCPVPHPPSNIKIVRYTSYANHFSAPMTKSATNVEQG